MRLVAFFALGVALAATAFAQRNDNSSYNAFVWSGYNKVPYDFRYPEESLPEVMSRTNVAVCFSGGGTRAYSAAMGMLRALHELKFMDEIRYIAGVSGGAWASIVYSMYNSTKGSLGPSTDDELLGSSLPPESLTLNALQQGCVKCGLKAATSNLWKSLLFNAYQDGYPITEIWTQATGQLFLEPFGIHPHAIMSFNEATKADMLARNPHLAKYEPGVILQHQNRPFLVVGASLVGPTSLAPLSLRRRAFTKLCMTPLYIGSAWTMNVTYAGGGLFGMGEKEEKAMGMMKEEESEEEREEKKGEVCEQLEVLAAADGETEEVEERMITVRGKRSRALRLEKWIKEQEEGKVVKKDRRGRPPHTAAVETAGNVTTKTETDVIGGLVEAFAFGSKAPLTGLAPGVNKTQLPFGGPMFTVGDMLSSTSWAPGALFAEVPLLDSLVNVVKNYWSPAVATSGNPPPQSPFFLGDGGDEENLHGISMVMRGVRNLVFVFNCDTPLRPPSRWNPHKSWPQPDDIEDDFAAYFGINSGGNPLYDISRNQMFNESDFAWVVVLLQEAQAKGKGMVVTTELETVENAWFGMDGGIKVNVTWVYLTRALEFEALLPEEVRTLIQPAAAKGVDPSDPSEVRSNGPFANFPHYQTITQLVLSPERANLLAHLSYWVTMQHKEVFQQVLEAARG